MNPVDYDNKINMLSDIKQCIESMEKVNQIEILRIFSNGNAALNENKNGIYINLSDLSEEMLMEIKSYIDYVKTQDNNLFTQEQAKEDFKTNFFSNKDNKDIEV